MFCLKPSTDDWNEPEFPHLYANIRNKSFRIDLDEAIEITSRPIAADTDRAIIESFALKIVSSIDMLVCSGFSYHWSTFNIIHRVVISNI